MGPITYILFACNLGMLAYARHTHTEIEMWQWGTTLSFAAASLRCFIAGRNRKRPPVYHDLKVKT